MKQNDFYEVDGCMEEEWKVIEDSPNYEVSSNGRVRTTGLVDKNGNEIFEWDVVSFSIDNGWDYVASENGLIIYWDGCYQILGKGIKYRINQCLEEDIEVIGNMYENPELEEVE